MNTLRTATAAAPPRVDPALEIERLRALLEKQPSCMMRIGVNGTLLAVNEVALSLLGARALADVLGTSFIDRLPGDSTVWDDFVRRVSQGGSASTECEMNDLAGVQRAVMIQGIALSGHPDGEESLLVAVRDVSSSRRLQASLQEQEDLRQRAQASLDDATATVSDLRSQLESVVAEQDRLRAALDGALAEREQLTTALDGALAEREQLTAALDQLNSALDTAIGAARRAQQVTEAGGRR
jgi:hypothetical protein